MLIKSSADLQRNLEYPVLYEIAVRHGCLVFWEEPPKELVADLVRLYDVARHGGQDRYPSGELVFDNSVMQAVRKLRTRGLLHHQIREAYSISPLGQQDLKRRLLHSLKSMQNEDLDQVLRVRNGLDRDFWLEVHCSLPDAGDQIRALENSRSTSEVFLRAIELVPADKIGSLFVWIGDLQSLLFRNHIDQFWDVARHSGCLGDSDRVTVQV